MPRPREFDEEEVLDAAVDAFWARGYGATSLMDLLSATGLSKGSLYKAYHDKHDLFLRCLDRYLEAGRRAQTEALAGAPSALEGLRSWLRLASGVDRRAAPPSRPRRSALNGVRGCFAVNSIVELGPHDPEVQARLTRHACAQQDVIAATLRRGKASGEIRPDLDVQDGAAYVLTLLHGLQVTVKNGVGKECLGRSIDIGLAALRHG
ncbi:MAG: TetR/AcrR family transcriptional regulator [Sandaracinaceae bacterium]